MNERRVVLYQVPERIKENLMVQVYAENGWDWYDLSRDLSSFVRNTPERALLQQSWFLELDNYARENMLDPTQLIASCIEVLKWVEAHALKEITCGWQLWDIMLSETMLGVMVYVRDGTRDKHHSWIERLRSSVPGADQIDLLARY